jgi:two-component system, OmpR family, sensor histidine kinase VicK
VFALTALCLLLSIVLASIITRSLTKPLKVLLHTTEAIAAGDLNVEAQVERTDEIGRLASAYDKMRLSLRSTIASLSLERQQTQAIIDATADGVILVDEAHKILKFNPAAEHLSGWRAYEAIGRYCWEVLGFKETTVKEAEAHEALFPLIAALQTRSEQSYLEMPITSRTGQERWLAISCAPMPLQGREAEQQMVMGLHDISQIKAVEQMQSHFVAMVSHELRAPLTTVTGSVEMLGLLDPATDTESYHEVLSILDQQTGRLRQVVEQVLQLTRFDTGRLEVYLQPLSITRFVRSLVEKVHAEWIDNDRCIIFHEPAEEILVWADGGLLEIVFRNLFDNARKYTPEGTAIEVEAEMTTSTGQVQIRVIDHGPGIPEDQLEHIFERFSRGTHSTYNWTRGYGLGLSIARELMLAHNGTIRAENRQQGACFVLSLWVVTNDSVSTGVEGE